MIHIPRVPVVPPVTMIPKPDLDNGNFSFPSLPKVPSAQDLANGIVGWFIGDYIQKVQEKNIEDIARANDWGNSKTLERHFDDHGVETNSKNIEDYAKKARDLYNRRGSINSKTDDKGVTRVYDETTGLFGSYNRDGSSRTIFKPGKGKAYWDKQPGK